MKRKKIVALTLSGLMVTSLIAPTSAIASDDVLRVATMPLTVGVPVIYADEMGYFEDAGLNVSIEMFATGVPINEAVAANEIDIAASGFASVYSLANGDCTWLADVNTSGGVALYAREDSEIAQAPEENGIIGSAEALEGLQILGPLGTVVQYMSESYAAIYGLEPTDINEVNMDYGPAYQAFVSGEGDIAGLNPPYSYQLEAEEGYVKLVTFEDATKVNMCDGCFVRNEVLEERPEDVELFLECLLRAMDDLQDQDLRAEYTKKVYDDNAIDTSEEDVLNEIADRDYVGTDMLSSDDYVLGEAWVAITDFLVSAEKITEENAPNVAASIDAQYISDASGIDVKAAD